MCRVEGARPRSSLNPVPLGKPNAVGSWCRPRKTARAAPASAGDTGTDGGRLAGTSLPRPPLHPPHPEPLQSNSEEQRSPPRSIFSKRGTGGSRAEPTDGCVQSRVSGWRPSAALASNCSESCMATPAGSPPTRPGSWLLPAKLSLQVLSGARPAFGDSAT